MADYPVVRKMVEFLMKDLQSGITIDKMCVIIHMFMTYPYNVSTKLMRIDDLNTLIDRYRSYYVIRKRDECNVDKWSVHIENVKHIVCGQITDEKLVDRVIEYGRMFHGE